MGRTWDTPVGDHDGSSGSAGRWGLLLAALIFLVAINLRTPLTSVGPLLPQISTEYALSEPAAGLLGALPLIAFALISPLVHHGSRRLGADRAVLMALLVLAAGMGIRSFGGLPGLWAGTLLLGCAIAVGNVLVPVLIRRDFPGRISVATAIYSACMGAMAAIAAATAVPVANLTDWRTSLALWAVPPLIVAALWVSRLRALPDAVGHPPGPGTPRASVWTQPVAWVVTAFMGLQSAAFFIMVTWLPTISTAAGFSLERGGLHLFGLQLAGLAAGLTIPRLMRRPDSQVAAAVTASVPILLGALGLLLFPGLSALWAAVFGAGSGSSLVVALSLISLRGRTQAETTQLSGMAQSIGYLIAAAGPVVAGVLAERSGSWQAPLLLLVGMGAVQTGVAVVAGRGRRER